MLLRYAAFGLEITSNCELDLRTSRRNQCNTTHNTLEIKSHERADTIEYDLIGRKIDLDQIYHKCGITVYSGIDALDVCLDNRVYISCRQDATINQIQLDIWSDRSIDDAAEREIIQGVGLSQVAYALGKLPLHCAVVELEGISPPGAIAICGPSAVGKSTLATDLLQDGNKLLCDDMAWIDLHSDVAMVYPGLSGIRLEPAIARNYSVLIDPVFMMGKHKIRYAVDDMAQASAANSLRTVFVLSDSLSDDDLVTVHKANRGVGLRYIAANIFNGFLASGRTEPDVFQWIWRLQNVCPVIGIARRRNVEANRWICRNIRHIVESYC